MSIGRAIEFRWTAAYGLMIDDATDCVETAGILARITAFLGDAGTISGAILISHTLRIAASGGSIVNTANAIASTR